MEMKIAQVISCRPNLVKFIDITGKDIVINTNQHYDKELLAVKVKSEIYLPQPEFIAAIHNLRIRLQEILPDLVIVYGDTKSALAGATVASEFNYPLAHIEAGVRLGDDSRIEEEIRRKIDNDSDYLFCVNEFHAENLRKEEVQGKIFVVGDLHYDKYLKGRNPLNYGILTLHRREHIGDKDILQKIFNDLANEGQLKFYCHPHTRKMIKEFNIKIPDNIEILEPINYERIIGEIRNVGKVITDSGGLTREAYFSGTPVKNIGKTEWSREIGMFGDGNAEEKIRSILLEELKCQTN